MWECDEWEGLKGLEWRHMIGYITRRHGEKGKLFQSRPSHIL